MSMFSEDYVIIEAEEFLASTFMVAPFKSTTKTGIVLEVVLYS